MVGGHDHVVAVVRHRAFVLGCRDACGSGVLSLPVAVIDTDPAEARRRLLDQLGMSDAAIERRGDPIAVENTRWYPFLATAPTGDVTDTVSCQAPSWKPPAVLCRQVDGRWWRAYGAVAPTVETVANDTERGSTAIAIDALWALRDAATLAVAAGDGIESVTTVAEALLEARPSMAALGNRVNGLMAAADIPAAVEQAATDGIEQAFEADEDAARLAAETVGCARVLTLSRSGTVRQALIEAGTEVIVLASRPGGEGVAFASELAEAGLSVSTAPDADVYVRLRSGEVDAVLVGADAVTPDGGVVNKVGTRAAALAAEQAQTPVYVVCACDKIRPATDERSAKTDPLPLEVLFDWTPPRLVTGILTEAGRLGPADVSPIAEVHRERAQWRN